MLLAPAAPCTSLLALAATALPSKGTHQALHLTPPSVRRSFCYLPTCLRRSSARPRASSSRDTTPPLLAPLQRPTARRTPPYPSPPPVRGRAATASARRQTSRWTGRGRPLSSQRAAAHPSLRGAAATSRRTKRCGRASLVPPPRGNSATPRQPHRRIQAQEATLAERALPAPALRACAHRACWWSAWWRAPWRSSRRRR